jgi:hypothetical protein
MPRIDKKVKTRFMVNERGELVKKIGNAYFPTNGAGLYQREVLILKYVGKKAE